MYIRTNITNQLVEHLYSKLHAFAKIKTLYNEGDILNWKILFHEIIIDFAASTNKK